MKRLMSITIALVFVFSLVFMAQVAETQAQMHMYDDDHMADYPWDDDGHMDDYPWDDDQINDYPCEDDHMGDFPWDDDHMGDFPWGDGPMAGFPWIDDNHMMGSPYYTPAMFWMSFWMLYMMVFMGPGF
jgi:hypothetical protein